MEGKILDLDKLVPEKRIIRLAGKEIDVSKIPSRVTLEIAQKADVLKSGSEESFPLLLELVVQICKPSQPDINADWLVDNTSLDQLIALIEFVLEPLKERAAKNKKNEVSPGQ